MVDSALEPFGFVLDGLRQRGIEVAERDLSGTDAVRSANAWSFACTTAMVPSILSRPPGGDGVVALDAIHFDDAWKTPFDPARSVEGKFHAAGVMLRMQ